MTCQSLRAKSSVEPWLPLDFSNPKAGVLPTAPHCLPSIYYWDFWHPIWGLAQHPDGLLPSWAVNASAASGGGPPKWIVQAERGPRPADQASFQDRAHPVLQHTSTSAGWESIFKFSPEIRQPGENGSSSKSTAKLAGWGRKIQAGVTTSAKTRPLAKLAARKKSGRSFLTEMT